MNYENYKLLIISNNVLSLTNNNGKTLYSFISGLNKENIHQLYFSSEIPTLNGYKYYSISDSDVIKGRFSPKKRGKIWDSIQNDRNPSYASHKAIKKNDLTKIIREIIWSHGWKSNKLIEWIDDFKPDSIFFTAGDSIFAYKIYIFLLKYLKCSGSIYLTDDYVTRRKKASFLFELHRKYVVKNLKKALKNSDHFFTISPTMRSEYRKIFGVDSNIIINMSESLLDEGAGIDDNYLIYTGSLYYGRNYVLGKIGEAIKNYNQINNTSLLLRIYTNNAPNPEILKTVNVENGCCYCGSLDSKRLKEELNKAKYLVFVESFDTDQIEKTKYSLSTKVPEYLSLGKPILAVGPASIGSMEYLRNVSYQINDAQLIDEKMITFLSSKIDKENLALNAKRKYESNHNKEKAQIFLYNTIFNLR